MVGGRGSGSTSIRLTGLLGSAAGGGAGTGVGLLESCPGTVLKGRGMTSVEEVDLLQVQCC